MNAEAKSSFIDLFPLFAMLTPAEKVQLAQMMEHKVKPKYSFIYMPEDASDYIYFLAKGTVKIGTHSTDGKEIIKSLIHPTAMFGELGLVGETSRKDFAQALKEDVHIYQLRVADMKALMQTNFELCTQVMNLFGGRLVRAEDKLESLIFKDARTRIIEFIKDAVVKRGRRVGYEMLLRHSLTHQDIANITCTSRQTVTLVLNELKKSDLIYFNRGKILVRDMAKLS
ncbi:Crp/Fnr family transcriptional regulator [Phaeodactylibacter luteus]|uniref:Crp/Fnr family transcriptional regulator n=1 Tax=Phaeodactylibacter luteus TaxID=1564516 RepID=A0A5C6RLM9_9BACT|nr:Crp/Fnr family transcriptional regulator [Phaeodactylibacter luteus]TXB62819.1 Crp/Fnr family transcriptional regulator [Phaeodactylibacter luteus]